MYENWAAITAVCALVTAAALIIGSFLRYEKRQTKNEAAAIDALQYAAEADENFKRIESQLDEIKREIREESDGARRDFGETVRAMQQKVHEFETWSRDEFVRKHSFEVVIDRMEKSQAIRDDRLEKRLDKIDKKLDDATTFRSNNS